MEIEGIVTKIIFDDELSGYKVCNITTDRDDITIAACLPCISIYERLNIRREWKVHFEYGPQIIVESYEKVKPQTEKEMFAYLTSGIFKGIGKKIARKIIKEFGDETYEIIQNDVSRLVQVDGISSEMTADIFDNINSQRVVSDLMVFLKKNDIDASNAVSIYKRYKDKAVEEIALNPYILVELTGINFQKADDIAAKMDIFKEAPIRIKSGIKYVLSRFLDEGSCYVCKKPFLDRTRSVLGIDCQIIEDYLTDMFINKDVYIEEFQNGESRVYVYELYFNEINICKILYQLAQFRYEVPQDQLENFIESCQYEMDIFLSDEQKEAVKLALEHNVMVITGGPGTGKTTIIKFIVDMMKKQDFEVVLAAPTGRAAKKLSESSGCEAKTLHRLLEATYNETTQKQYFEKNDKNPIETDVIIVDEVSMVDINLFSSLLKAILPGTKLVLVGDSDQLPSVGPGNVLNDIISSDMIKVVKLKEIFRQAKESMIVVNAHRINIGFEPLANVKDKDFYFICRESSKDVADTVIDLCARRLPNTYQYDPFKDIQVLSPMRKGEIGILNLNEKLQQKLNCKNKKHSLKIGNDYLSVGDRVMQIRNNYNIKWYNNQNGMEGTGVYNGDIGIITSVSKIDKKMEVLFDNDKCVEYDYTNIIEVEKSYAITIHKSQGSEYPVVIIPLHYGPSVLMTRNLLYTAVTRAKEIVIIVGSRHVLRSMLENKKSTKRNSSLKEKIVEYFEHNCQE